MRDNGYSYNDYLRLTRGYLKNLPIYQQAAENLQLEIADEEAALKQITPRAVSYGTVGGGTGELTPTEQAVDGRQKSRLRCQQLRQEHIALRHQCDRIERALKILPPEEMEAVDLIYFKHFSYTDMSRRTYTSARTCRRRLNSAVQKVAVMLFGLQAEENILFIS